MYLDNSLFKQIEKIDEPDRSIGLPIAESTVVYDDRPPVLQRSVSYSEKKNKNKITPFKIMLYYDEGIVLVSALKRKITVYFCSETEILANPVLHHFVYTGSSLHLSTMHA